MGKILALATARRPRGWAVAFYDSVRQKIAWAESSENKGVRHAGAEVLSMLRAGASQQDVGRSSAFGIICRCWGRI